MEARMVERVPKIVGVQSAACAPLFEAFVKGWTENFPTEKRETLAEGIAIANPVRGKQILQAIRETGGEILAVTENEIRIAMKEMSRRGHFIEPTSAATVAGLKKYLHQEKKKEVIVSTLTGMGLKSVEKMLK
jgi:threonine synthase